MAAITGELLAKCRTQFQASQKYEVAQNAVSKFGLKDACLSRSAVQRVSHHYSHRVPDSKPITNQQHSGRCWLFAATNAMRCAVAKAFSLESFEFSQQFLFFWDKVERANYFLETVIETRDEARDGRVVTFLLSNPLDDGGQWDMMTALVLKHGLVPKHLYPDAHAATASRSFQWMLAHKVCGCYRSANVYVGLGIVFFFFFFLKYNTAKAAQTNAKLVYTMSLFCVCRTHTRMHFCTYKFPGRDVLKSAALKWSNLIRKVRD